MEDQVVTNAFRPLTYLAVPYSYKCPNPDIVRMVQRFRFEACTKASGWLMNKYGWTIFSPITHSHPIHLLCPDIPGDWQFWKKVDLEYLACCCRIVVLTLPGWRKSTGVTAELEEANRLGLELFFIHPREEGGFNLSVVPQAETCQFFATLI